MKYIEEFQDPELARRLLDDIHATVTRPWALMEVCGGQTHTIIRHGIDQLLPEQVELIHGPGCPVCVTPLEVIDKALEIASRPDVIFCSFGDMLRVPGTGRDLFQVRSEGGDVRVVYSPLDALKIARQNPGKEVVFFGIGFETTAPPNAMTVHQARKLGIRNFSLLVSHVRVPPAIEAIMQSPSCRVQGFLAAGHVCSVVGGGGSAARPAPGASRGPAVGAPAARQAGGPPGGRPAPPGEHTKHNAHPPAARPAPRPPPPPPRREKTSKTTPPAPGAAPPTPPSGGRRAENTTKNKTHNPPPPPPPPPPRAAGGGRAEGPPASRTSERPSAPPTPPATPPARRHHGVQRGRLRRVLPLPAPRPHPGARRRPHSTDHTAGGEPRCLRPPPSTSPAGPARPPCGTAPAW